MISVQPPVDSRLCGRQGQRGDVRTLLVRTAIGGLIGAFFVWLSARDWPSDQLSGELSLEDGHLVVGTVNLPMLLSGGGVQQGWAVELWWLLPYVAVLVAIHAIRVVRWKPLLDPIVEMDWRTHNRIGAVGFMAMFILPLRLGEFVRPYLVKHETGQTRTSEVLSTVVIERIADGLTVVLVLFCVLFALPAEEPETRTRLMVGAWVALLVFSAASLLLLGARWQHTKTLALVEWTAGLISKGLADKITGMLNAFLGGLRALPSPKAFAWFLLLTLTYWGINGLGTWLMAKAFHLPIDLVGGYAMMACVIVGMMIPNSPGNVGSFWYFLLLPLPLYGVGADNLQAIAFGLTVWLMQLIQQGLFGAWYLVKGEVTWGRVLAATSEELDQ